MRTSNTVGAKEIKYIDPGRPITVTDLEEYLRTTSRPNLKDFLYFLKRSEAKD